ncbi:hypothetical protein EYF80_023056 [Liparis tanakae]|uniref:Uncharacterized protein n=1 Tax=Liparis tanakae TaxID=230148 RepID=A0A4Z2HLP0_9TELE|nr:hypothetical protein EYF80_023056 [Liparis tanakae]
MELRLKRSGDAAENTETGAREEETRAVKIPHKHKVLTAEERRGEQTERRPEDPCDAIKSKGQSGAEEDGAMTSSVKGRGHNYNTDGQTAQPMSGLGLMFYLDRLTNEK